VAQKAIFITQICPSLSSILSAILRTRLYKSTDSSTITGFDARRTTGTEPDDVAPLLSLTNFYFP